jgi:hypothetical protein
MLHNLYPSSNTTAAIKSRRGKMGRACSAHGILEMLTNVYPKNLKRRRTRDRCEDNNNIDLKQVVRLRTGFSWLRIVDSFEHGNKTLGSTKAGKCHDY